MRPLILLLAAAAIPGCALLTNALPSAEVTDVRLTGVGLVEQRLAVTLCLTNPNRSALGFSHATADLDVAGALLAAGESDAAIQLPPLSSTAVPFTVLATTQNIGTQLLAVIQSGGVDYRLHGSVTLQGGLGLTIPYSRSGRLDLLGSGLDVAMAAAGPAPSRCASTLGQAPA